jgi:NADH-quinone oxidoreductase subunit G
MLEIEIDGKQIEVPEGSTVMDATRQLGAYVPHFCYHPKLSIAANCRMCLVQVEKAPKPLPACATPVTNGMKVWTHSEQAVTAQKGVMEFLLINHPLDCPICDQGGECQLQDLAVGYGGSASRYQEAKRVVVNKNLGPLISTDMTRCIHCTRCVRFGQEIAGIMELGMIGRGEHSEIITFVGKTVDSELSGNVIDLCPVGALTSKPFRYSARTWELVRRPSVSPHCGLGSNLMVQVKQNRVMRVLPRENESINECWLSDKDRFSYEALNSEQRLPRPMIRQGKDWKEVSWQEALEVVAAGLKRVRDSHGSTAIGALATPHQTVEELYLLQKLMRGIGSSNVDFRLRQSDFSADGAAGVPWLGMKVSEIGLLDRILVIGSNLRQDHPLLAHRIRQAAKKKTRVCVINAVDRDLLMPLAGKVIVAPSAIADAIAQVVSAVAEAKGQPVPALAASAQPGDGARNIATRLADGERVGIFLGNLAQHHPEASRIHALSQALSELCGGTLGFLGEAANSVGGYLAGAVPGKDGLNAAAMVAKPLKAYVLLGVEPELDMHDTSSAMSAMQQAEFVVALSPFQHGAVEYAHVMLPISPFTETAGTFVNTEGCVQSFTGIVQPLGETRPAWKVLRVIGNLLGVDGFDHDSADDVKQAALPDDIAARLSNRFSGSAAPKSAAQGGLQRIAEIPIYAADALARRSSPLQNTVHGAYALVRMAPSTFSQLGLQAGDSVRISQGGEAVLAVVVDEGVPEGCVCVPAARAETATLGPMFGPLKLERVAALKKAAG